MSQLTLTPTDDDADRVSISPEKVFITVMGRDRPERVCCAGSAQTLGTWYTPGEGSSSAAYQHQAQEYALQIHAMEERLRTQQDLLSTQQEQISQLRDQVSDVAQLRDQVAQMQVLLTQFQRSQPQSVGDDLENEADSDSEEEEEEEEEEDDEEEADEQGDDRDGQIVRILF